MNTEKLKLVREFQREKQKLLDVGMRTARRIAATARVEALRAYGGPVDVARALVSSLDEIKSLLEDAMIAGHLAGRLRSIRTSAKVIKQQSYAFGPYDEATQFMKKRLQLTESELNTLKTMYSDTSVYVTREIEDFVEKRAQVVVKRIAQKGMHVREGISYLRDSMSKMGIESENPWLLENIVRTQISLAYSAGRWNLNQDPDVQEILWGYEYITVGDERVRHEHEAMEGARYPKEDGFWDRNFPPNGFSCRCEAVEIFNEEAIAKTNKLPDTVEIDGVDIVPQADVGWQYNPGKVYRDMIRTAAA